jgi:molybdate-binding protein
MPKDKKSKKKEAKKETLSGAFIVSYNQEDVYLLLAFAEKLGMGFSELNDEECRMLMEPAKEEKKEEKKEKKKVKEEKKKVEDKKVKSAPKK